MRLAWRHAAEGDYDGYLWLNDDVELDEDGFSRILCVEHEQRGVSGEAMIVVGSTRAEQEQEEIASYGGMGPLGVLPPGVTTSRIELFNGNIVLVTREAFEKLGNLSASYTHGLGDIDYGIRARRAGIPVWLAPGCIGSCASNRTERWRHPKLSVWQRLWELHRPTGCPPWQLARLVWRNGGWWFPWSVAKLYCQAIFPSRVSPTE
jgi:GT2 family glycosyltransferase